MVGHGGTAADMRIEGARRGFCGGFRDESPTGMLRRAGLRRMIDGYDCGIRYMDLHIGRIFDALAAAGVTDDLAVIISADHGENQGELEIYGEHATADNTTCRVPLIVRRPGAKSAGIGTGLHHNLDLAPTLADLLSQEPRPAWDGRSFAKAVTDGADRGKDYLVISQCYHVCQRAVRFDDWIYIRTYHDGYHLFPDEILYNVADDPHEQHDLAAERPDLCDRAAGLLQEWHDEMMRTMPRGYSEDPMQTVLDEGGPAHARGRLKQYCERLEATGRADAIPRLKRRHRREFE